MFPKTRLIIFLSVILFALITVSFVLITIKSTSIGSTSNGRMTASGLTGDFTLIDENEVTVTPSTFAGQYKLIFFGFTHCPSICPTELLKIADIMAALPSDKAMRVTPIFITVDPRRDTADVIKKYTDQFDSRIVGLTGTEHQIRLAIDTFKVYAARVDTSKMSETKSANYSFDHSTFLYLFSPRHELIKLYRMSDTADQIAPDLLGYIE